MLNGTAAKFVTSLVGLLGAALLLYYGTAPWEPLAAMALASIGVYLVPNADATVPTPAQAAIPDTIAPSWPDQHAAPEQTGA